MEKVSGIYKIINKVNGKYYVGSSENIFGSDGRFYFHKWGLRNNKHYNEHLQRAYNKYGDNNFEFILIEQNIPKNHLLITEQKYLDIAKNEQHNCYNKSFIAGKIDFTPEVREKMSMNSKLRFGNSLTNPNIGKPCSRETRQRISLANKGRKNTEESKKKMSQSRIGKYIGINSPSYGKPKSQETKNKISKACKGKNTGKDNYKYSPTVHTLFNKLQELLFIGTYQNFYNTYPYISKPNLTAVLKGKRITVQGWKLIRNPESPQSQGNAESHQESNSDNAQSPSSQPVLIVS